MRRVLAYLLVVQAVVAVTYPSFKQCSASWSAIPSAKTPDTICQAGSGLTAAAMALAGIGKQYTPDTLNTWLNAHSGYAGSDVAWGSLGSLGLSYVGNRDGDLGTVSNANLKAGLDANNVVLVKIASDGHWVLATGYNGDTLLVNDPSSSATSYPISAIVANYSRLFKPSSTGAHHLGRLSHKLLRARWL